jgi:hypothetical protein
LLKILCAQLLVALVLAAPALARDAWDGVERIVAVGDVHGDYGQFLAVLRSAGLIDEKEDWSGGATHLVQTGDIPDRGPDTRKILDLLMKLEKQARRAKGFVHPLIGNHEAMNVYGDLRYVIPGEYAAFADGKSERVRERFYERHVDELKQNPPAQGMPAINDAYRAKWEQDHPLGYFEHRMAFQSDGEYGKWIRNNNAVVKINDTLFLHGGIGPKYVSEELGKLNQAVQRELTDFSRLKDGVANDPEGPLWYRGLAQNDERTEEPHLEAVLKNYGVSRVVIGHTPTAGAIMPRFGGRVVMIDVGMSAAYGGRLACLLIEGGKAYAIHRGKKLALPADSPDEMLKYLTAAAALDPQPSPLGPEIMRLETSAVGAGAR